MFLAHKEKTMNKLGAHIGLLSLALAVSPKLLEKFNKPIETENTKGVNLSESDRERIESAKKKRARKREKNKK